MNKLAISIVGGGNGVHAMTAIAAAKGYEVRIWAPLENETEALKKGIAEQGYIEAVYGEEKTRGRPVIISSNPADVIPNSDIVIFVLPAFTHEKLLKKINKFLSPKTIIGAMPSRSGFEFMARSILGTDMKVFGLQTLPWACRINKYGRNVDIIGKKSKVNAAALPINDTEIICAILQEILGVRIDGVSNMLAITLGNVGQIIHPGIMYGLFKDWNSEPFTMDEVPYFYHGVTEDIALILEQLSKEVLSIKRDLEDLMGLEFKGVLSLKDWLLSSYQDTIEDKTTLQSCFNTNISYKGLKAPIRPSEKGGYIPDFSSRYLTEDIPNGLVVIKALAQLTGTHTKVLDEVILQTSSWMDKEYLYEKDLKGKDIKDSPIPQNYGIDSIAKLRKMIS